jgi:WD40 repeat protein
MAGELPANYVERPREIAILRERILELAKRENAVPVALRGAGGYGKTTIAAAICHDYLVQEYFTDGVLWVTLGRERPNTVAKLTDLVETLTGERPGFTELDAAISAFADALGDRRFLLVIDDIWRETDAKPFMRGGRRCVRLLTTRIQDNISEIVDQLTIDAMAPDEAIDLMRFGLPPDEVARFDRRLRTMLKLLGEWPILINLVNGTLRTRVIQLNQPFPHALRYVETVLESKGLSAFDYRNPDDRNKAVSKTLELSFAEITDQMQMLHDLAIFPEDSDIPLLALEQLWRSDANAVEDFCVRLVNLSLIQSLDLNLRQLRIHDVIRSFLRSVNSTLNDRNKELLIAYGSPQDKPDEITDPYIFKYLAYHLAESSQHDILRHLLGDFRYLSAKVNALDFNDLLDDFEYLSGEAWASVVQQSIQLSGGAVRQRKTELAGQLRARLMAYCSIYDHVGHLLASIDLHGPEIWLKPIWGSLTPPGGGLDLTLNCLASVFSVAVSTTDAFIVSASDDWLIRLWDLRERRVVRQYLGHKRWVRTVVLTNDGTMMASGSEDFLVKIWNVKSGISLFTLSGHMAAVRGIALDPFGRLLASCSNDHTIRIWNFSSGHCERVLTGHTAPVTCVAFTHDGKTLVSAAGDGAIKLWSIDDGRELQTIAGHEMAVNAVAVGLSDRELFSGSDDKTIKKWDLQSGGQIGLFTGHSASVSSLAITADGATLLSSSEDRTLKTWDIPTCLESSTLWGHRDHVHSIQLMNNGRKAVSGSRDGTIRVWDLTTKPMISRTCHHAGVITGLGILSESEVVIWSANDGMLKMWALHTGEELKAIAAHGKKINAIAFDSSGRRLFAGSDDGTVSVWDSLTLSLVSVLEGHHAPVTALALCPDDHRGISGSSDGSIIVWDLENRWPISKTHAQRGEITCLAVTPDCTRIVFGVLDKNFFIMDLDKLVEVGVLIGHIGTPTALKIVDGGAVAITGGYDRKIKIWDLHSYACIETIGDHAGPVYGLEHLPLRSQLVSAAGEGIRVQDLRGNVSDLTYSADSPLTTCSAGSVSGADYVVAGDSSGYIHCLVMPKQ